MCSRVESPEEKHTEVADQWTSIWSTTSAEAQGIDWLKAIPQQRSYTSSQRHHCPEKFPTVYRDCLKAHPSNPSSSCGQTIFAQSIQLPLDLPQLCSAGNLAKWNDALPTWGPLENYQQRKDAWRASHSTPRQRPMTSPRMQQTPEKHPRALQMPAEHSKVPPYRWRLRTWYRQGNRRAYIGPCSQHSSTSPNHVHAQPEHHVHPCSTVAYGQTEGPPQLLPGHTGG